MRQWLFRTAVAVLAVALGVVVGAGPLQRSDSDRDRQLDARAAKIESQQRRIQALESAAAFGDAFGSAAAPTLLRGALAGRPLVLVTLPGADPDVVEKLRADVTAAQGRITAQVDLAPTMARSSSRQLVEALTSQMVTQVPTLPVPADAGGYARFGLLLARALGTGRTGVPAQAAYDNAAVGIISGLESAELVTVPQPVGARAGLALVVAGPEARNKAAAADNAVPVTILQAFASQLPTVVVGSTGAAGPRGVLGALRASTASSAVVSTVDSAETSLGQVAGILALAARARGTIGQYGAVDAADGAIPGAKR
jgi:hypothetical protein